MLALYPHDAAYPCHIQTLPFLVPVQAGHGLRLLVVPATRLVQIRTLAEARGATEKAGSVREMGWRTVRPGGFAPAPE